MRTTIIALATLLLAGSAAADEAPVAAPAGVGADDAERLLAEGERLFADDADFPAALDRFERAYDLVPSARALNGMAAVYQLQGRPVDAFASLERLLAEFGGTLSEGQKARIRRRQDDLRPSIGLIEVVADQPGTRVVVDGREIGHGPLRAEIAVDPGRHSIAATLPGHSPTTRLVDVGRGGVVRAQLALARVPVPVPAGRPLQARRRTPWLAWSAVGTGAALAATGAWFRLSANGDFDDAHRIARAMWELDQRPVDVTALDEYQRGETKDAVAYTMWAVGGAAVVTGAVLVVLDLTGDRERRATVVPTGSGAAVHVSF